MNKLFLFLNTFNFQILLVSAFCTAGKWRYLVRNQLKTTISRAHSFQKQPSYGRRIDTPLKMVIDRMSDDSVGALVIGHEVGNSLGLESLTNELIFVGIVNKPERAGRTFARYGIKYALVKKSAVKYLQKAGYEIENVVPADNTKPPLPFSKEAKTTLNEASKIADTFGSPSITSEHVLLALMAYNFGKPIDQTQITTAREIFLGTEGNKLEDKRKFSAFDFCEEVTEDMKKPWDQVEEVIEEQVVIGGGSGATNTLAQVGTDLTQIALEGGLDKVFGRDDEIRSALRTLGRRRKNNPCLIGDPGVGKTAIAEAIAQVLASSYDEVKSEGMKLPEVKLPKLSNPFRNKNNDENEKNDSREEPKQNNMDDEYTLPACPKSLSGFRLISVDLASLVAGTRNRGDFEEKIQELIKEASNSNIILFVDEIHNLVGTGGGGDGAMNAANLLKPALSRGELKLLGATTTAEYRRYIEKDGALERRFQPLQVNEPSVDETFQILKTIEPYYESYHGVEYTENSLKAAAKLSDRYISDRFLPDKAIDLLDEAGSMVKMTEDGEDYYVTEDSITTIISEISGIPVGRLETDEKERLRKLELIMGERIKGQNQAVRVISKAIRRARSGMRDGKRPISSLLFLGPSGVGKTESTKVLANTYFGTEKDIIRIDMSEYMDRFSTTRLTGSPPGYVGYEEGGQLTEAVRRKPHSVVLFDEVEKAHEDVLNVLLQIMDEGTLTDGKGRTVNFKNTIVIMTSNVGSQELLKQSNISDEEQSTIIQQALEKVMKPELRNRIDKIVYFNSLSYEILSEITTNIVKDTVKRIQNDQDLIMTVSECVSKEITRLSLEMSNQYGARPIRRAVQTFVEDTMSDAILREFINPGDEVLIEIADKKEQNTQFVKITKFGRKRKETLIVPIDDDEDASSAAQDLERIALQEPSTKNDDSPPTENDAAWE